MSTFKVGLKLSASLALYNARAFDSKKRASMFCLRKISVAALGAAMLLAGCAQVPTTSSDTAPSFTNQQSRCLTDAEI
ncbi:MAG: hypothetical protein KA972_04080, partial [Brachymonas sp.]|nr:hypothetical protein [Brachymonas sp.]